jgi:hypothetical protein
VTPPHYADESVTLYAGDALDVLRGLPDNSVDSIVTDPPAGIAFMGKAWDGAKGGREQWSAWLAAIMAEALRVTKPGGHALVWALPRTAHWTACGLEDAGWEIRDRITHLFGSGFPKSLDVGKALDRIRDWTLVERLAAEIRRARTEARLSLAEIGQATLDATGGQYGTWYHRGGHMFFETGRSLPSRPEWDQLRSVLPIRPEFADVYEAAGRQVVRETTTNRNGGSWADGADSGMFRTGERVVRETAPATDAARRWDGWGTALKPAAEDWWLCRKPLEGTVAGNVVRWGTGAINVDGCRVATTDVLTGSGTPPLQYGGANSRPFHETAEARGVSQNPAGRWPTNALLDTAAAQQLDRETGVTTSGSRKAGEYGLMGYMGADAAPMPAITGDTGGASRFFPTFAPPDPLPAWKYEPKAPAFERPRVKADGETGRVSGAPRRSGRECNVCGNRTVPPGGAPWPACGHDDWSPFVTEDHSAEHVAHPTVKPLDLIRWLCRLITPPGGVILDCFAGSGTTGEAAVVEGFKAILVEREPAYLPLIVARLSKPIQPDLFGGAA